jgi:hypothetical protein
MTAVTVLPAGLVASGQGLPTVCARHGLPATAHQKARFVSRPPGWSYILIVAGVIAFVVVTMVMQKKVSASNWPVCDRCRRLSKNRRLIGIGVLALSLVMLFAGIVLLASGSSDTADGSLTGAGTAGLFLLLGFFIVLLAGVMVATRSAVAAIARGVASRDGNRVEFTKADPAFAQQATAILQQAYGQFQQR